MKRLTILAAAGAVALSTALAQPATAAPRNPVESYSMSGVLAEAKWSTEVEPAVGEPRVFYLAGADAVSIYRLAGTKPVREPQPAVLAMGLMLPGPNPGDEPFPAEIWLVSPDFSFSAAADLGSASLSFSGAGEVVVWDPETGEEVPYGETVPLTVTATWTETGGASSQRSRSWYSDDLSWSMDYGRSTTRPAVADVTITGPDGVMFDGTVSDSSISDVRAATLLRTR